MFIGPSTLSSYLFEINSSSDIAVDDSLKEEPKIEVRKGNRIRKEKKFYD